MARANRWCPTCLLEMGRVGERPESWHCLGCGLIAPRRRTSPPPDAPPDGRLFQEDLAANPFWLLVACSLVNVTTWTQAEPAFRLIRERWPTPTDLATASPEWMHGALRPLGLWRQRSERLVAMARAWLAEPPERAIDVERLPGCGKYARDSWALFVDKDPRAVCPTDGKLTWYLLQGKKKT